MKQQAVTLKEKEFNLHHSNCMTIGTQAAVLAGLDITMFIEFTPLSLHDYIYGGTGSGTSSIADTIVTHSHHAATVASNMMAHPHVRSLSAAIVATAADVVSRTMMQDTDSSDSADATSSRGGSGASGASGNSIPTDTTSSSSFVDVPVDQHSHPYQYYIMYYTILYHIIHFLYYSLICTAFCCNVIVVAQTTILSVLGAGLALRGPDGSMMTATNILYQERSHIFQIFGYGLTFTILSVFIGVWLMFQHWTTALSCWCIATYTCYFIYTNYIRVSKLLYFPDNESVDLHDLLSITSTNHNNNSTPSKQQRQQRQHPSTTNTTGNADTDYYDDNSHNHYDDDDTFYSSENPETESFIRSRNNQHNHHQQHNNSMNHSRQRRRPKYQNNNNNNNHRLPIRNNSNHTDDDMVVSTIQMV
jgi:hypothetical protein